MPRQIYTDKDYLDAQFQHLNDRLDKHDKEHEGAKQRSYRFAGLILTAAGIISGLVSTH